MPSADAKPLVHALPTPAQVRDRLTDAMREVVLLRRLLKLSEEAARYRECDRAAGYLPQEEAASV
jgi:hypothetical protein